MSKGPFEAARHMPRANPAQRARRLTAAIAFGATMLAGTAPVAYAQDDTASAAQANNPLANTTAFNLQNYYIGDLTAPADTDANQFWLRYATPFKLGSTNWLLRASLPVNTYPVGNDFAHKTGLGDLNVFAAYLIDTGNPAVSFGVGPQVTLPTATHDGLGTDKYSMGLVNVLFNASSPVWQYGYLLSWQHSVGGSGDTDVNVGAFQPFLFYQLGGGHYLRTAPIWAYNFENDSYSVPLGIGYGKIFKRDKVTYNMFVEPQWSVADKGAGWAKWQVYVGFNMQFAN